MYPLRLALAYLTLTGLSLFIASNMTSLGEGSGYLYLAVALAAFGGQLLICGDVANVVLLKRTTLFLGAFFFYFAVKHYFESEDPLETRQLTIGTTGGVFFAFGLGAICSYTLAVIYQLRRHEAYATLTSLFGIAYMLIVLVQVWLAFQGHAGKVTGTEFLIDEDRGKYQRAGNFAFIQILVIGALAATLMSASRRPSLVRWLPFTMAIVLTSAIVGLLSQVIGSNSGLVTAVAFVLVFIGNAFAMRFRSYHDRMRGVSLLNLVFSPTGIKIALGMAAGGALILVVAGFATGRLGIDPDSMRITGFGTGRLESAVSRSEILKDNFFQHLFYSPWTPIFGNSQVDKLTTGDGTYVHSLIALLPHLGVVGLGLFCLLVFSLYREIVHPGSRRFDSVYTNARYGMFRLTTFGLVIAMGIASAFYTWMPLWFVIGLFGEWFYQHGTKTWRGAAQENPLQMQA